MSRRVVDIGPEEIARLGSDLSERALARQRPKLLAATFVMLGLGLAGLLFGAPVPLAAAMLGAALALLVRSRVTETRRWQRHAATLLGEGTYVVESDRTEPARAATAPQARR